MRSFPLCRWLVIPWLALAMPAQAAELLVTITSKRAVALPDAVVFIDDPKALAAQSARPQAEVRQTWRQFDPFVTVVATGTPVDFPNYDFILHHVYSNSVAKRFEIKLYKGPAPAPIVFDRPGVITVGCNMHDWMLAYIVVADSPWFAKADSDGVARIADLPGGTHRVMAWYPGMRAPIAGGSIEVTSGRTSQMSVVLDVTPRGRPKPPPHDPLRY